MMGGFLAVLGIIAVAAIGFGYATLGAPNHNVPLYEDSAIRCAWDNIDGDAWCISVATQEKTCSWHIGGFDVADASQIPKGCWPSSTEAEGGRA